VAVIAALKLNDLFAAGEGALAFLVIGEAFLYEQFRHKVVVQEVE
jgi:hypothetical protein